uniref:Uncharacterized protein n=1 Tax=Glossina palpalis gambiensis TaxID=67801 RepID=A0A1B0C0U4_9MUSC
MSSDLAVFLMLSIPNGLTSNSKCRFMNLRSQRLIAHIHLFSSQSTKRQTILSGNDVLCHGDPYSHTVYCTTRKVYCTTRNYTIRPEKYTIRPETVLYDQSNSSQCYQ